MNIGVIGTDDIVDYKIVELILSTILKKFTLNNINFYLFQGFYYNYRTGHNQGVSFLASRFCQQYKIPIKFLDLEWENTSDKYAIIKQKENGDLYNANPYRSREMKLLTTVKLIILIHRNEKNLTKYIYLAKKHRVALVNIDLNRIRRSK